MMEKIKNFFAFIGRAWVGGRRGRMGILFLIIAIYFFVRMFMGSPNLQQFVINIWRLNSEQKQLVTEQETLNKLTHHIELIVQNSPDYIEELGLKRLNKGDPRTKILRF